MGVSQCIKHRQDQADRPDWRLPTGLPEEIAQIRARHILENEIKISALFTRFEYRHDVRMAQLADHARFGQQLLIFLGVGMRKVQGLDCHFALKMRISRQIDDALGTAPQFTDYLETSDPTAHADPA